MHRSTFSTRAGKYGCILLGVSAVVNAQDPQLFPDIAPASPAPPLPEAPTAPQPASYYASSPATASSALVHEQAAAFWGLDQFETFLNNPLRWGPFQLRPFGSYRFTYGDGLNVTPGNQVTTAVHEITPGALLQSEHVSFHYAPTLTYYSSEEFEDGVNHSASVNANFGVNDWKFTLGHSYSKTISTLIETGAQTPQQSHNTILSASHLLSDKTSLEFNITQIIQEADAFNSSIQWTSMNWANYHWTEKTAVGVGVGGGYTIQDFGADMTHEQIQGRIGWTPSTKLVLGVNGGVEFRQFISSDIEDQLNPIYGASVNYIPWEATVFSLSGNRSVGTSLVSAQITEVAAISLGVRQRFFEVLHLDIFTGFQKVDYQGLSVSAGVNSLETDRSDDILSLSTTLGVQIFEKGSVSVFYQHSKNDSSAEGLTYNSDQYGFQVGYHF